MNRIFVIIVNWNGRKILQQCLESIKKADPKNKLDIVIVDNHSEDDSLEMVRKKFSKFLLICNKDNLGWSGGNNIGIKYALKNKADFVFLLNNDVTIEKITIKELMKVINKSKKIGIAGPKTYYYKNNEKIIADAGGVIDKNRFFGINRGQGEKDCGQFDETCETDFISGSAMLIKSEVFKKIGLFDERFYLYYEDTDFCLRAKKSGYLSMFSPKSIIYHKFGETSKIGSPLHNYYTTRNHYLFIEKNAPFKTKLKEFFRTPKTIIEFLNLSNGKFSVLGVRDYYFRKFGKQIYW